MLTVVSTAAITSTTVKMYRHAARVVKSIGKSDAIEAIANEIIGKSGLAVDSPVAASTSSSVRQNAFGHIFESTLASPQQGFQDQPQTPSRPPVPGEMPPDSAQLGKECGPDKSLRTDLPVA